MEDELLIYTNKCLTCGSGDRMGKIVNFAKKNGLNHIMKRVYMFPELEEEALVFGVPMPFVAFNGKAIDYYSINDSLLDGNPELEKLIER